ncbi:MAG: prephenate dehydratase [Lachnospiraceae bacterium]|nr:prephenate dehydratase [Lachnospiraceae bacterium]
MELNECRNKIDAIDKEIVRLYEERMVVAEKVADYKILNGMNVLDRDRERSKINAVKSLTHSAFNSKGIEELYNHIMSISRKRQYDILEERGIKGRLSFMQKDKLDTDGARIVYQGIEGAYSEEATIRYFGENCNRVHVDTFKDAMGLIDEGLADFAVLPIENSSAGIVTENYDLLTKFENYIVGTQIIDIKHCLAAKSGTEVDKITDVFSHEQAIRQCRDFLDAHRNITSHTCENTAMAAAYVANEDNDHKAAICSERCAKLHGLEILSKEINYSSKNSTKFIIVTNQKIFLKNASKVSICFEIPDNTGSLYHVLSLFYYNDVNMSHIESRPISEHPGEYRFFVDFEGNLAEASVRNALHGLREETVNMKVLGNY